MSPGAHAGSLITGMFVGKLQLKVSKAEMLDDFLLMPALSIGDDILGRLFLLTLHCR